VSIVKDTTATAAACGANRLYGRLWRWHFFAAFIVIPFVLWQSVTGTLYLWSERWMDAAHSELRFVSVGSHTRPASEQVRAALGAVSPRSRAENHVSHDAPNAPRGQSPPAHHGAAAASVAPGPAVQRVLIAEDPRRSTAVLLQARNGLPYPVFVDPYTAQVLGSLSPTAWLPGLTRALHGGWPLGDPGSWLLELGDGWAIVMIVTGLYLWWPRGRGLAAGLWPRVRSGRRVLLRDLHSCVAVWFSIVFLFFLISALPWTAFWGGRILSSIESATGQSSPTGFSPGGASLSQFGHALPSIDEVVTAARSRGVRGTLDVRLAPWPEAPVFITNANVLPAEDRTLIGDSSTGAIRGDYRNDDLPAIPRFVALGIHVHQGDFGWPNLALNTAFALSLIWLSVTGALSWWIRRPKHTIGAPPRSTSNFSRTLLAATVLACLVFPLLGLSVLCLWLVDLVVGQRVRSLPTAR